ncbi:MAG: hypothetical protein ABJO52_03630, partial [Nisaea sp.]
DAALTPDLAARIIALARYAEGTGPAGILYTCSAFGEAIEEAARTSPLPVLKPNEAMFEEAFGHGPRVAMIYTFPAAVEGMAEEFREEAARRNSGAGLTTVFAEGAREALAGGDAETHNRLIAETVARTTDADVFLLAHFSMAPAAPACRAMTDRPVLTAPEAAVRKMKALVETRNGAGEGEERDLPLKPSIEPRVPLLKREKKSSNLGSIQLKRHKTATAYQLDESKNMFSDLTQSYWRSATTLHREAILQRPSIDFPGSPMIASSIVLYIISLDSLLNSILARVHIFVDREDLNASCYEVAKESFSKKKIMRFMFILQLSDFADRNLLHKLSLLSNLRGEVVHFVPVPSPRNEWRCRVLEAVRSAGVSRDEMLGIDTNTAMTFFKVANWCRAIVLDTADHIQNELSLGPQLFPSSDAVDLGVRSIQELREHEF